MATFRTRSKLHLISNILKEYLFTSQQYLNPITKDKPNEVRFISHFGTITTTIKNIQHNFSELNEILEYVSLNYKKLTEEIVRDSKGKIISVEFKNGSIINNDENANEVLVDKYKKLVKEDNRYLLNLYEDEENSTLLNSQEISESKNEFLFNHILDIINKENPEDNFSKSKSNKPYIEIYTMGLKTPLIFYYWNQIGLIETLTQYGIDYEFNEENKYKRSIAIPLKDTDEMFIIKYKNKRQELLVNGLLTIPKTKMNFNKDDMNKNTSINSYLHQKYGTKTSQAFHDVSNNMIDPTTSSILEFYEYPKDINKIFTNVIVPMLLNKPADHPSDLKNHRVRGAEYMSHLLYNNIIMAKNLYGSKVDFGSDDAKLFIDENYLIDNLLGRHVHARNDGGALLEYVNPYSAVDELVKSSKVVKTGKGGIPSKRAFRKEQRSIHESYIGNISAHSTSEYADVGITNHHCLGVNISNSLGSYGSKKAATNEYNLDSLSIDEALTPFCSAMDSSRLIIARTHAGQKIPIKEGESAVLETGAEYVAGQLASSKFVSRAKRPGKVKKVKEDKYMVVEYEDGEEEIINIMPRYSSTKRASTIMISMENLKEGEEFDANQMLTWNKLFDGRKNTLANGRNLTTAIMGYNGYSFEDGYVFTEKSSDKFITESIKKVKIVIPPNTNVLKIIDKIGIFTDNGESLVEFQYESNIDDYINNYDVPEDIDDLENEEDKESLLIQNESNNVIKKTSPGGEIVDMKIYLNTKKDIDGKIMNMWKKQNKEIKEDEKILTSNAVTEKDKLVDNIDQSVFRVGTFKFGEGAQIVFYIKKEESLKKGNKVANRYGAKGVITNIIPEQNAPYCETMGEIETFIAPSSVLGRKNTSIFKELYIGKIIHLLPNVIADKVNNGEKTKTIVKLINDVYDTLDTTNGKSQTKEIIKNLSNIEESKLREKLKNKDLDFNIIIPPFTKVDFKNIKTAAEILDIPLEEYVYLPEFETYTKTKVPVGIQYMSAMEQTAEDYESTRSQAGYVGLTGQPTKGKRNIGGQSLGNNDVYSLLTYDSNDILNELMTVRSDDVKRKRMVITNLRQNGQSDLPPVDKENNKGGQTREILNIMMLGLGLELK